MDEEIVTESTDTGTEESTETTQEEVTAEAPVAEARKFRVKIDGKDVEVDEQTLLNDYQLSKASYARMQQAAELRREAEDQIAQIRELAAQTKQDPRTLFKALGLDARAFAEALLTEELENELLTDEERELRDLRAWKQRQETDTQTKKQKDEQAAAEALTHEAAVEIELEILDALKTSGIKATPRTVARVAEMILASLESEGPRMKASDALARLTPEYRADVAELLEAQDPETIERDYPSLYKKILNHAANKSSGTVPTFSRGIGTKKTQSTPAKAKTWDEWMK